jgi:tRNA(Ile2) C34 agmatinyltransferase TiaS
MSKISLLLFIILLSAGGIHGQEVAEAPVVSPEATPEAEESAASAEATPESESPAAAVEAPVIPSEDIAAMESKLGSEVIIEGVVASVGSGPNGNITFLNFGDRRSGFVAVVFRPAYERFPDGFDKYAQQKVRVRGSLEKYRDRQIQIKILTPDQIEIVAPSAP